VYLLYSRGTYEVTVYNAEKEGDDWP